MQRPRLILSVIHNVISTCLSRVTFDVPDQPSISCDLNTYRHLKQLTYGNGSFSLRNRTFLTLWASERYSWLYWSSCTGRVTVVQYSLQYNCLISYECYAARHHHAMSSARTTVRHHPLLTSADTSNISCNLGAK